jgi:hypothetical protein
MRAATAVATAVGTAEEAISAGVAVIGVATEGVKTAEVVGTAEVAATAAAATVVMVVRAAEAEVAVAALDRRCTRSTWCSRRSRCHHSHHTTPGQCTWSIHNLPCR